MWLTKVSVKNPVFATMMMLALLVLGIFSYRNLAIEQFPDIKFPIAVISTKYTGATPSVVENDVTRKIEESMNTIAGVNKIYSNSYEGLSVVVVEFTLSTNVDVAMQDVRDKLATVKATLRDEVDEPTVGKAGPDDRPMMSVSLSSNTHTQRELTNIADQLIVKQFQTVKGVGQVNLVGGVKRQIHVLIDPTKMAANQVSVDQLMAILKSENQQLPVGNLISENNEIVLQVNGKVVDPQVFGQLIVARHNGTAVRVRDVARVVDAQEEQTSAAFVNGKPGLAIDISKVSNSNTVEVSKGIKAKMEELQGSLPKGMTLGVVYDGSVAIQNSLDDVNKTMVEGALLTVFVVFLFLGSWRSTLITGVTLPISLVGTIFLLGVFGFSINMMTMMALSLCIGLLIDDSIVVRENITRHLAMGKGPQAAALEGTKEIGLAVLATTLTIVAVFLPVGFMGGIIGKFFFQFGVTVAGAVLISMFVSFTLDPMLSSVWHDPHSVAHQKPNWPIIGNLLMKIELFLDNLANAYAKLIHWCLGHRIKVLLLSLGVLMGSFFIASRLGAEFVPEADLSELLLTAKTPVGSSLAYTSAKVHQVENVLKEMPEVKRTYSTINTGFVQGKNQFSIRIGLVHKSERDLGQKQLIPLMRSRLAQVGGVELKSLGVADSPGGGQKPIFVSIQGGEMATLVAISKQLEAKMQSIPGMVDIESSVSEQKPMISLAIKRDAASDLGVGINQISNAIRPLVSGDSATTWEAEDGQNYDVLVRLPAIDRERIQQLSAIRLLSTKTDPLTGLPLQVALSQVVDFKMETSPTQINRRALQREVRLTANVDGRPAGNVGVDLQRAMDSIKLPPGYRFEVAGANKDMQESFGYAVQALALAVIFIYMILASQFGSFLHPLAIMTSLPLSLIGVFLGLGLGGQTLNIFSIIGVIMLMGLVTKNAILLVDFVEQSVKKGMNRHDAIIEAGRVRLRPILMTTFAMVFGMVPLALGLGEGGEQQSPMGDAVIGGVLTSTLLTLVVVPVVYTYLDDLGEWILKKLHIHR
ncbi:efflux RND transporter permease subunit [Leeia sp. TBRC 13508]|uniref:Efflux RND transporter permease subunit n=1 Tax=Leeia speluncae TaxID=2884804 RepID=A0ABS8DCF6_9NEIS|nr:efflux RND transporter permease subunit [Leeia speluncae]MCB6185313.1 efflux RND transporter permease subunit [Leeia speluncae]